MSVQLKPITQSDYWQYYAHHPTDKYELIDGMVYAQAGASRKHNAIGRNLLTKFTLHLQNNPCQPYMSDLKVKVGGNYFYPDVVIDCGMDDYIADKPVLIIEVLSKSTAFLDKTKKLYEYAQLPSLQEYATVSQDKKELVLYRRANDWQGQVLTNDYVYFACIDLSVAIDEIYAGIVI